MISAREWQQIVAGLGHAAAHTLNGSPVVRLIAAYELLATFAEPGCTARVDKDGGLFVTVPEPRPEHPPTAQAMPPASPFVDDEVRP